MSLCGDLEARAYDRCVPLHVSLELTLRCNIRCTHCYNFDRGAPRRAGGEELSMAEIRALLDELRAAGTLFLALTGGEAMSHPSFWEIADEAAARAFAVELLTNGTLLTEEAVERLAAYPNLLGVSVSVYGARAETHDAVTRAPGSFRKTWDGAKRLRARGLRTALKYVVLRGNTGEVAEAVAQAEAAGVELSVDTTVTGRYDGTSGSLGDRAEVEEVAALYRGPLRGMIVEGKADPTADEFKCNCARGNAAVSATGEVWPCIATPLRAGSIREQGFREIWEGSPVFRRIRGLGVEDFKSCAPCDLKAWCRRSPGPAYLLTGDYTGIDPWTCQEAAAIRDAAKPPATKHPG